ncbi:glycoside hydrolase family protein [Thalassomonas viridans]|uniref:Lysozyme n=1 Tax=Thalassomonas viridans TaxID=137584 RepID=A0AAF0C6X6_9GAMM|nr:glycoside hydrolase family protein [Thalassomonas viridans]WDE04692.1 glycoside hydrolase family protein [Thalassomonas viridans]
MSIQNTVEQIKKHEGFRSHPYYCTAKKLTLGYGRNLDDVGINEQEAEILLQNDLNECKAVVKRNIDTRYCNDAQIGVLINMAYNLGAGGLMAFKKMRACVEAGDFQGAANEMLDSRWAQQVPVRAEELAKQMVLGEWQRA